MPLKSKSQMRALFAKDPKVAREFVRKTPRAKFKRLPERSTKSRKRASMGRKRGS